MFSKCESQDLKPGSFTQAHTLPPKPLHNAASLKTDQVSSGVTVSKASNVTLPNLSQLKKYSSFS